MIFCFLFTSSVEAAVQNPFPRKSIEIVEVDLSYIEKNSQQLGNKSPRSFRTEDYIPVSLAPTNNKDYVANRILLHSVDHFLKLPQFRQSSVGQVASTVEQSLNPKFVIKSDENKNAVVHQVQFIMKPSETSASIKYEGYVKAQVAYQVDIKKLGFEVSQNLSTVTRLAFNHTLQAGIVTNMVSFNWSF